jgi:hypothetical protein
MKTLALLRPLYPAPLVWRRGFHAAALVLILGLAACGGGGGGGSPAPAPTATVPGIPPCATSGAHVSEGRGAPGQPDQLRANRGADRDPAQPGCPGLDRPADVGHRLPLHVRGERCHPPSHQHQRFLQRAWRQLLARLVFQHALALGFLPQRGQPARPVAPAGGAGPAADRGGVQPGGVWHLRPAQLPEHAARPRVRQLPRHLARGHALAGDGRLPRQRQQRPGRAQRELRPGVAAAVCAGHLRTQLQRQFARRHLPAHLRQSDGAQLRLCAHRLDLPTRRRHALRLLAHWHQLPVLQRRHGAAGCLPRHPGPHLAGGRVAARRARRQHRARKGARQPDGAPQHRALHRQAADPAFGHQQPQPRVRGARGSGLSQRQFPGLWRRPCR